MSIIENKYINYCIKNADGSYTDGLSLCDNMQYTIRNCVIDLSKVSLNEMDEAIGITWGASATIENCVIRGAGKLILCGCGDEDKIPIEKDKSVVFKNCILENFSRRGPEVQNGMKVKMYRCLIQNWGDSDRFSVRSFAGWAHGEDSEIYAEDCLFKQKSFYHFYLFDDLVAHIGQAVNDSGLIKGIFSKSAWQPGICKGLVSSCGGKVTANHCWKNKWWIDIENNINPLNDVGAIRIESELLDMKYKLYSSLGIS